MGNSTPVPKNLQWSGKAESHQVILHTDPKVRPVAQPLRCTPFNLCDKVSDKINELLNKDIIEPVGGLTPWLNPVVIVPKIGGDIHFRIDMRRANEAIIRTHYSIPLWITVAEHEWL